ncbi:MAG: 1-(5-phosphoribosyl)-5-[(5-phosphoribosylamino)methylideneamino]imidazole-4-carboxamide isomerase [Planctomycetota bacterium]|jgi:phosphoribosylformimino-5-aminoimidazole carboxamide ribotide isomerase
MLVYPAIDIAKGKCVRLIQGRADEETVYYEDPLQAARHWQGAGARALHVVDLDGALSRGSALSGPSGEEEAGPILSILKQGGVAVQVAGGLRSEELVRCVLEAGAARAVVGTRAVREPQWAVRLCGELPGRIVVALDARNGRVAVEGWRELAEVGPLELARRLETGGPAAFLYTDISRDGMMSRPNFAAVEALLAAVEVPVIASGGVASVADLRVLGECGADAVIVGKALYERRFTLPEALEVADAYPSRLAPAAA